MTVNPLNGSKTHPLSPHAKEALGRVKSGPIPGQQINPGVINRLRRSDFIELIDLPSPYKTGRGRLLVHVKITQKGIDFLEGKIADPMG